MFLPRSNIKPSLLINKYAPSSSFLSPAQKYNHRSFSASSSYLSEKSIPTNHNNNLREQIRLQSFKKSVMTQTKLNKTNLKKATLKLNSYEPIQKQKNPLWQDKKQNSRQTLSLLKQNQQLKQLRNQDLLLISKQNQLILSLQRQLALTLNNCQQIKSNSYKEEEAKAKICNYQIKIEHLEQELKEYKRQIREFVIKQQEMKHKLYEYEQKYKEQLHAKQRLQYLLQEKKQNMRRQDEKYEWGNARKQKNERIKKEVKIDQKRKEYGMIVSPSKNKQLMDSGLMNGSNKDLQRYYDYLGKLRNRQIDSIDHILKQ